MRKLLLLSTLMTVFFAQAQQSKRVLFLGNSYTYGNNLPQLVANVAQSQGDNLVFDSNTPGGHTLNGHSSNVTSQSKIAQGNWDYVVMQEQSQLPSFPYSQFSSASLPYAITLGAQIKQANPCAKPIFFMTWGRKNGDQSNCATWPPVCTYSGMQGLLRERYIEMADSVDGEVSPVGAVWRDMRSAYPNVNLYTSDNSHPNINGSYLAACTFYASIFHKSPIGAVKPANVDSTVAYNIQSIAHNVVFDSLNVWMIDTITPKPDIIATIVNGSACLVDFDASTSQNVDSVYWDFGDGTNGSGFQVSHQYTASGTYKITAHGWRGCQVDSVFMNVQPCYSSIDEKAIKGLKVYPNPTSSLIKVEQYNQPVSDAQLQLFSISGERLLMAKGSSIDISRLAAGVYIMEVKTDNGMSRLKVVRAKD